MEINEEILTNAAETKENLRKQVMLLAEEISISTHDSAEKICRKAAMLFEASAILERASAFEQDLRRQAGEHSLNMILPEREESKEEQC